MRISEKINFKKYLFFSSILLIAVFFLARNSAEIKVMLSIFTAACLNQYMLVRGVLKLTSEAAGQIKNNKFELLVLFLGKIIVLIVALTIGVQIMEKRIIIPVLIYVLQIVVLYLSLKKPAREKDEVKD